MDATFEQLLTATGLADLPPDMQPALGKWFAEELQLRTGEALVEDMDDELFAEFEAINDGDTSVTNAWLAANATGFENDPLYSQMYAVLGDRIRAAQAFAARKWLEKHRPDHPHVAKAKDDALVGELADAAPRIRSLYREIR